MNTPIRVHGTTAEVLKDILRLIPLDQYCANPVEVMDRVDSDKAKNLFVPAYNLIAEASGVAVDCCMLRGSNSMSERRKLF
jgi:L-fucose mutarotase/ribose pyranase (RbsD/FucU family)